MLYEVIVYYGETEVREYHDVSQIDVKYTDGFVMFIDKKTGLPWSMYNQQYVVSVRIVGKDAEDELERT